MWKRTFGLGLLAALMGGFSGGCKKSSPAPAPTPALLLPPPIETVARFHWLGKQRLAANTNAALIMGIWELPESKALQAQTLDRLAVGLFASKRGSVISNQLAAVGNQSPATNHPSVSPLSTLLRPLLEDLVQRESFAEVRQATNQPGDLALAIRLNDDRVPLWRTNLAALFESLTGGRAAAAPGRTNSWHLQFTNAQSSTTRHIELASAGEWLILGLGQETNALADEMLVLIQRDGIPFAPQPKEFWFYADVDLRRVASALLHDWQLPAGLPRLTLSAIGQGETLRSTGQFNFPKPLPFALEPWNIPTNLIHEPLVSFTAVRGITAWLSSLKTWQDLQLGPSPGQLYFWAQKSLPIMTYCAASLPNTSNAVYQLTEQLVQKVNPWLDTNGLGQFQRATNFTGAIWADLVLANPYLKTVPTPGGNFAFAGLESDLNTGRPAPAELLNLVLGITNLVAYDWELTGTRIEQWLYFGQLLRFALHKAQVPPKSASFAWLTALETRLPNCGTVVVQTGPAQLSFVRNSAIGLSAAELDWLADWLESPSFPRGLNTFVGEPTPIPPKKSQRRAGGAGKNFIPPAGH